MADEVGEGIADTEKGSDAGDRPYSGCSVPVRIDRFRHRCMAGESVEQAADLREDDLLVRADQAGCTDLERLGAIRSLTQYQDGFAEGRCLLLQTSGIGQHDAR